MCTDLQARTIKRCDTCRLPLTKVQGGYVCENRTCPQYGFPEDEICPYGDDYEKCRDLDSWLICKTWIKNPKNCPWTVQISNAFKSGAKTNENTS